jgi:hypothetical protein
MGHVKKVVSVFAFFRAPLQQAGGIFMKFKWLWIEVGYNYAREKVGASLRDCCIHTYRRPARPRSPVGRLRRLGRKTKTKAQAEKREKPQTISPTKKLVETLNSRRLLNIVVVLGKELETLGFEVLEGASSMTCILVFVDNRIFILSPVASQYRNSSTRTGGKYDPRPALGSLAIRVHVGWLMSVGFKWHHRRCPVSLSRCHTVGCRKIVAIWLRSGSAAGCPEGHYFSVR